jgi:carbon storage regulator CsrA
MLVLSRRLKETIRFPGFNTSVQILSIKSGVVRLGIEAPPDVNVVRGELPERAATWGPPSPKSGDAMMKNARQQDIGQQLQTVSQALGLARFQLRTGQVEELQATLDQIQGELQTLRRQMAYEDSVAAGRFRAARKEKASAQQFLAGYLD